jgi:hypothetical protein
MNIRQPGEGFEFEQRNSARAKNGTKFPLKASAKGEPVELVLDPTNAVQSDPSKGLGIRTHSPLTVSPGSQPALTIDLGESMAIVNKKLEARPKIADVQGLDASLTVGRDALTAIGTALASEISDRGTADGALDTRIAALESVDERKYTDTLSGGTVTISITDFADDLRNILVWYQRVSLGTKPGVLTISVSTTDVTIDSNEGTDDGIVEVFVRGVLA